MQKVIEDFEKRVLEVDKYFMYLKHLSTPGALLTLPQSISVKLDADFLEMIKANSLLILYNLIEFAIRQGILEIYHQIKQEGFCYEKLRPEIREIWIKSHYRKVFNPESNWNTAQKEASIMVDDVANKTIIQLGEKAIPLSGNLDAKEIRRICELHKISYAVAPGAKGGSQLLAVKTKRNELSHGNISFLECGHELTLDDLEEIKNEVIIFIRCILNNMKDYVDNKQYALSPPSS
ncbi:hypothetical protein PN36_26355 [Candidatus Thiomargarita nelsonii]|uniref:MAE-28990/MAE-18760-like HEPN domain-containing protein n=1 Tax=Candidatus Thiomargarita nelsonii TaxID=1003181 RepID=A0A0A6P8S9_9GAMM|nr:hypothetical protein PN36_26355 [Candidatus Thiomargarita nelsonii]